MNWRQIAVGLVALGWVGGVFAMARQPAPDPSIPASAPERFRFSKLALPGEALRRNRTVNPALEGISAWISSVGAAVALNDIDGDGLPNDVCYVDTRDDQVRVAAVPFGTRGPARYAAFGLTPSSLPFDTTAMAPMGCLPGDFNEDGRMDLMVYYWGRSPVLFLRKENGTAMAADSFAVQELLGGGPENWNTNAATTADVDGDGHLDLIVGNYFPDCMRVLAVGGTCITMQHSMSRAANGGRNRMLLWKSARSGEAPAVSYADHSAALSDLDAYAGHGWTLAVGAADLDGDLLPEIYIANDFGPDRLLYNQSRPGAPRFVVVKGRHGFTEPRSKVLGRDSFKGMGVDFADLNGDGYLDIFVSNIAEEYALEESHFAYLSTGRIDAFRDGTAPYVDHSEPLGLSRSSWSWDARFADFDNDGTLEVAQATGFIKGDTNRWPELHEMAMANDELLTMAGIWHRFVPGVDLSGHRTNAFFVAGANGRYVDVTVQVGFDDPTDALVSRGIAVGDMDGDGYLDVALANQWAPALVLHNRGPKVGGGGGFIGLKLLFPPAGSADAFTVRHGLPEPGARGRPAVGATARLRASGGGGRIAQVDGGSGHSGKSAPDIHFGLGGAEPGAHVAIEIRWRDPAGAIHAETHSFTPGWHTVWLGGVRKVAEAGK